MHPHRHQDPPAGALARGPAKLDDVEHVRAEIGRAKERARARRARREPGAPGAETWAAEARAAVGAEVTPATPAPSNAELAPAPSGRGA